MAKVVLVTGASAGIGRVCADRLAAVGWTVVGGSRRGTGSAGWQSVTVDVDDDASVSAAVADVAAAGWGLAGPVEMTPIADAKAQLETNFFGVVRTVNAVLPKMREQGGGRIIIMSSIGGVIGIPFQAFYSASKFALEGYGEALAYEIAPYGVNVTLVEPGNFKTDFTGSRKKLAELGPYAAATAKAVELMERDEEHGADPAGVATCVEKLLTSRRPPRRVSVGKAGERVGIIAKRLMPFRMFEKAASGALGV